MNEVHLLGRMVKEVDLRYISNGTAAGNFTVAVQRGYKNQSGEYDSDFIRVSMFGKTAETVANYFTKGSRIIVHGEIKSGSYEKDGKTVYTTEVKMNKFEFVDSKKEQEQHQQSNNEPAKKQSNEKYDGFANQDPFDKSSSPIDISDSDLPF